MAYFVWLIAAFIATAAFIAGFREGGAKENAFLLCLYSYFYIYANSFIWSLLQSHLTLEAEIKGGKFNKNKLVVIVDEVTDEVLKKSSYWLFILPFYYWLIRISVLVGGWLKDGYWSEFTTCDVLPKICLFESKAVGLNKIILWIGTSDFGIAFTALLLLCGWIASKNEKSNWLD